MFLRSLLCRLPVTGMGVARSLSTRVASKQTLLACASKNTPAFRSLGGVMSMHDTKAKGDEELVNFLAEEIATEKKNQRGGSLPTTLDGFQIKVNQSEVTLTKKINNETMTISLNVNHTVDADFNEEASQSQSQQKTDKEAPEMRSRPNFEVDIVKGGQTLKFTCSYLQEPTPEELQQDEYQDAFVINEISLYEGEWNDEIYAVAGDILDGYLYDLFMNMLEDRGLSNEFVDKLSDFCSDYEHDLYVGMLGKLQNFLTSK